MQVSTFYKTFFPVIICVILFTSCRNTSPFGGQKPPAMGRPNQVDIIMDGNLKNSLVWDSLDFYFTSAFPVMPAPEPFFDLRHLTPEDLESDPYKKEMKTMVFVADISDSSSVTSKMVREDLGAEKWKQALSDTSFTLAFAKDKWAKNQLLIYLFAKNKNQLARIMHQHFPAVASKINRHDEASLEASLYGAMGENTEISGLVQTKFGIKMSVPPGFVLALQDDNFLWLRSDDKKSVQNFVIRKFEYTDKNQFTKESLIRMRDEYGKKYIQTSSEEAYMQTNPVDLPVYEYPLTVNGAYGKEYRGIWETVNDFMGGPFFSYLILKENTREIIFIDAFILAPGEEKRDMMQKLDYVVKKVGW